MKTQRIGLIRVLTTEDKDLLELHGKKVMSWFPELEVVSRCIPDQPEGIHDDATEQMAVPKVVNLAKEFESEGFDGILISCAGDPAVNELKDVLSIPVVGAGRTTACIALSFDLPIGVLGITDEVPVGMKAVLRDRMIAWTKPSGVTSTLDLMTPTGRSNTLNAAEELKQKGVKVIALACTGMATIGVAPLIAKETGLIVVDPLKAAAAALWTVLKEGGN
ncbi:aspartate/glutamate racemase family protein [Acetomicrobium hydrogeniformans]|uniref:Asp/Glu/Hydantoin racemase n=1 Tax=Acetomicrobium hydrogeniformans ATCC BAA-1850 TaxID=592015 RepID=A0A0T5XEH1_9BACT|nr:aspartate/glutamate racemase family protein [Acetomicrobium hydrogeniformans]KRT36334.1 Asp/Glu/Hydantoin racemase [Acetomicrobium hydrogeniformans ATCC BAA-1850]